MTIEKSILEIDDVVDYLKLSKKAVKRLVKEHYIPYFKIGNNIKFKSEVLDEWLETKMWQHNKTSFKTFEKKENQDFSLASYIKEELVVTNLKSSTKKSILLEMIGKLISNDYISNGHKFIFSVLERENLCSTGIGRGIAIPHPKNIDNSIIQKECIMVGISKKGVNYKSIDNNPVHLLILSCFKDRKIHLKMISKLNLLLRNKEIYDKLINCETHQEVIAIFDEYDKY